MFIRSERLFLRPCWPEDRAALALISGADAALDPVAVVLGSVEPEDRRSARFLVTLPGTGVIGAASLSRGSEGGELRLWIDPAWRNCGYATEAVEALADIARLLGHDRLEAVVFRGNGSATRLLERTGFAPNRRKAARSCTGDAHELPRTWFQRELTGRDGDGDGSGGGADTLAA